MTQPTGSGRTTTAEPPLAGTLDEQRSLRSVLADSRPLGPPSASVRRLRTDLADFLRQVESRVFAAPAPAAAKIRELLGWDDESLANFIDSPMVVHSATHVSMNAFPPMLTFPWFCLRQGDTARPGEQPVHLRTLITHNNLSDNRWKPHVWWHLDASEKLVRTQLFSKARRVEHEILLCQSTPDIPTGGLHPVDARAVDLARYTTNFAYYCMVYRISLEREAGMHRPGGTVEVPMDILNAFTLRGTDLARWRAALGRLGQSFRVVGPDRQLRPVEEHETPAPDPLDAGDTMICPNYFNLAQAYRFGLSATMGAEKMSRYVPEMNRAIVEFMAMLGENWHLPRFLGVAAVPFTDVLPLSDEIAEALAGNGTRPSLPAVTAHYGAEVSTRLDTLLDRPVRDFPGLCSQTVWPEGN